MGAKGQLLTLPLRLRSADEAMLRTLPPALLAEAQALRERLSRMTEARQAMAAAAAAAGAAAQAPGGVSDGACGCCGACAVSGLQMGPTRQPHCPW